MFSTAFDLLLVVIGFGAVVFIHELGHFLAARWAGIRVLAFAVGFGPALVSFRKGLGLRVGSSEGQYAMMLDEGKGVGVSPTEYRLNILPFGGYVKMLGQEDGNPYAVSDDSDSFQSCKPWKRMIVISAGVVMNVILAAVLFVIVFMAGMKVEPARVGAIEPGSAAALAMVANPESHGSVRAGLKPGDEIVLIQGRKPNSFSDIVLATAMAEKNSLMEVSVKREGEQQPLEFLIRPRISPESGMLDLGIEPTRSTKIPTVKTPQEEQEFEAGLKSIGLTGVKSGMELVAINGQPARDGTSLFTAIRQSGGQPVTAKFAFAPDSGKAEDAVEVSITPRPELQLDYLPASAKSVFPIEHLLGLTAVISVGQTTERAEKQGLKNGDIFARIGSVEYPSVAQGMAEIRGNAGRTIPIVVLRKDEGGALQEVSLPRVEINSKGQIGFGVSDTSRDSALISLPLANMVRPGSDDAFKPAARGTFDTPGARIVSVSGEKVDSFASLRRALRAATAASLDTGAEATVIVELQRPVRGIVDASAPVERVSWTIPAGDIKQLHALGWESPIGQGLFAPESIMLKAASPMDALTMGLAETKRVMLTTYVTFLRLYQGTVKIEHLKGPVGIAHLGTLVAGKGMIWLLFFLALISVNLAVINFLPLPIVDGGQFLFILFEQVRGKPVPLAFQNAATLAGLVFIGCIFLFVTFNDIKNLLGL